MIFIYIYHTPRCGRHHTRASQGWQVLRALLSVIHMVFIYIYTHTHMWQTSYKGFPVVTSSEDMAVVGYIRRQILQRMIAVALEEEAVRPDTPCIFSRRSDLFGFFVWVLLLYIWRILPAIWAAGQFCSVLVLFVLLASIWQIPPASVAEVASASVRYVLCKLQTNLFVRLLCILRIHLYF